VNLFRVSTVLRVVSGSGLALALLAGSALAQSAARPDVKVGDQWQFVVYYGVPSAQPNRAWVPPSSWSSSS
jgi:hypothetical protein